MDSFDGHILLTGATGVVGSALLDSLSGNVTCLVHSQPVGARDNVACLKGDITRPGLGLHPDQLAELADGTCAVVNAAAITDYSMPWEDFERVNVEGTQNVVDFAIAADAPLYHLSTVGLYFDDDLAGTISTETPEDFSPAKYVRSKREAEAVVRSSGHPASLIRVTWVLGHSRTGVTARFQGVYLLAQAILEGSLPVLPAVPEHRMDFLPQDLVADAVAFLVREGLLPEMCWLTAGDQAITIAQGVDVIRSYAQRIGVEVELPRFVDPGMVDRLIRPAFMDVLPRSKQLWFEQMVGLMGSLPDPFPSSLGWLADRGLQWPFDPLGTLATSLEYWGDRRRIRQRVEARQKLAAKS